MQLFYRLLVVLSLPLASAVILWRGVSDRGYWRNFRERFGFGSTTRGASIWVHAVSVGEVQAAAALVRALRLAHPQIPLTLTTVTATGAARAQALFGKEIDLRFLPFDSGGSVRRFFDRVRPRVAIILEKELWPNLLRECKEREVPIVLASAAFSPRAQSRYRRLAPLFRQTLASGVVIAAQSEGDAERFRQIGVDASQVRVIGNLKFDFMSGDDLVTTAASLRAALGGEGRLVLVGGSTYELEEMALLAAQRQLRAEGIDLALVLAPRHPPRFDTVAGRLQQAGVSFTRRSRPLPQTTKTDVLLLDTLGELLAAYSMADLAFVGGSLVTDVGGHNLIEPAALAVPTLTGPHEFNAPDIVAALRACGGLTVVENETALLVALRSLLRDAAQRKQQGEAGRAFVERNRGTLGRLLAIVEPIIASTSPPQANR